jgi:uncharacterized membrane protein YciS (DUF1049 family)
VLDCADTQEPPFSKGMLIAFRKRLMETNLDRRLIERTMEVFLFMLFVVGMLIFAGVFIRVRLSTQGALATSCFRRIRRLRSQT